MKIVKLYELPRGSRFRLVQNETVPPDAPAVHVECEYTLKNIDGMYSYCTDEHGQLVHVVAWAEVEPLQ